MDDYLKHLTKEGLDFTKASKVHPSFYKDTLNTRLRVVDPVYISCIQGYYLYHVIPIPSVYTCSYMLVSTPHDFKLTAYYFYSLDRNNHYFILKDAHTYIKDTLKPRYPIQSHTAYINKHLSYFPDLNPHSS